jgi:hypothetical protein
MLPETSGPTICRATRCNTPEDSVLRPCMIEMLFVRLSVPTYIHICIYRYVQGLTVSRTVGGGGGGVLMCWCAEAGRDVPNCVRTNVTFGDGGCAGPVALSGLLYQPLMTSVTHSVDS